GGAPFSASPAASWCFPEAIHLPRLGRLRLKERGYLPTTGPRPARPARPAQPVFTVLSATLSEQVGHCYVSLQVQHERESPCTTGPVVGSAWGGEEARHPLRWHPHPPTPGRLKRRLRPPHPLH